MKQEEGSSMRKFKVTFKSTSVYEPFPKWETVYVRAIDKEQALTVAMLNLAKQADENATSDVNNSGVNFLDELGDMFHEFNSFTAVKA